MYSSNHAKIHFLTCSVIGKNNVEKSAECEDVIYIDNSSEIEFFGLADGQTGKKNCREGGKEVLKAMFRYIKNKGLGEMIQFEHVDELRYELNKVIRDTISELASAEGEEIAEYASTLVIFAYTIQTGNYVIIHLGDGSIIGQKKGGDINMLSSPENGLTRNYTWLTTSQEAFCHLRIAFGNIKFYSRILLMSDGASIYVYGRNIMDRAKKMIQRNKSEDIVSCLKNSNPVDDASCIVIDFA